MDYKEESIIKAWWNIRRLKYNKGLVIAGFTAFIFYCIVGETLIAPHEEFEETFFAMFFQGIAYCFMMGLANLIYSFVIRLDIVFNSSNSTMVRNRLYWGYFWISFSLPILFILMVMIIFLLR